jgi:hypothetical protein
MASKRAPPLLPPLSPALLCTAALLAAGTLAYRRLERWSYVDCFYATSGVLTTVGIVVVPTTPASRAFTAALNVASLGVAGLAIAEISEARRAWARRALRWGGAAPSAAADALAHAALALPAAAAAALALARLEGWGVWDAAYFTLTCATGLGMGDVEPVTPAARVLLSLFLFYIMGSAFHLCAALGLALRDAAAARLGGGGGGARGGEDSD